MAFAADPATQAYYERRAAEYDDWWEARACSPSATGRAGIPSGGG